MSPPLEIFALATLMLTLRLGPLLSKVLDLAAPGLPASMRALIVLGLAATLAQGLVGDHGLDARASVDDLRVAANSLGILVWAAFHELALGIILATVLHAAFAAVSMAGNLLDVQIGFGVSQIFDPGSMVAQPLLTTLFDLSAGLIFFLINGHHAVVRLVAASLYRIPLGAAALYQIPPDLILTRVGSLLALCFSLAAPAVMAILLTEMALAVLARGLPQINMLALGLQLKAIVGLLALALWTSGIGATMDRLYQGIYSAWDAELGAAGRVPSADVLRRGVHG